MPVLGTRIHDFLSFCEEHVDRRDKPGDDDGGEVAHERHGYR